MQSPKQSSRNLLSWGLAWALAVLGVQVHRLTVPVPWAGILIPFPRPLQHQLGHLWLSRCTIPLLSPHLQSVPSGLFSHRNQGNLLKYLSHHVLPWHLCGSPVPLGMG